MIDPTQVEYECVYRDGSSSYLHLGCAGLLDAEQRRVVRIQAARDPQRDLHEHAEGAGRHIQTTSRNTTQRVVRREALRPGAQPLPSALQGFRILLVEDHDDTREVLTRVLTTAGARVVDAPTAIDALPLVAMCDLVVTDLAMSGRDGRWLLAQIEAGTRRVPVIALTAYREDFDLEGAPGFDRVMNKPVDPVELVATTREVLDRHRRRQTGAPTLS